jgi:REP element-mobilizing transposase RayT
MALYKNRYRVDSTRLLGWDYSSLGYYFVTICTQNRIRFFGEILNGKMVLNDYGNVVYKEWIRSFSIRQTLIIDDFIVMPNHFHAIIHINNQIETSAITNINWKSGVLGAIIGQFKQQVTKNIRNSGLTHFAWQSRFHDHIIRDEQELIHIRNYINNNPKNWQDDSFNNQTL